MNTSEGRPNTSINGPAIEEIQDYENATIRSMLEEAGIVKPGDAISADDYEATKSHAIVLAREIKFSASAEALLLASFSDRMRFVEQLSDETIKNIPDEALRKIMYIKTGYKLSNEELVGLRRGDFNLEEWTEERSVAKNKIGGEFDVAVNEDAVIARGTSPEEAMRNARKERGEQV